MKKTAFILMVLAILMKVIGFSREILISYYYGASYISDAYLIALTIPGTVYTIIGTGLITGFIPMYSRIEREARVEEADVFTSNFINFVMLCCAFLVIMIYLFTRPIIHLFAIGFEGEVLELTVIYTRITTCSIFFTGIVSVYSGYLQVKEKFLLPALMSLPFNICIILSILLSYRYNHRILAYGSVAAELAQFLFLLPIVYQSGFRHKPVLRFGDKYLKQTILLAMPIILGVSINQINILIDKTLASQIAEGGISALNYAGKLNGTIQAIFISSVVAVLFPAISKIAAEEKMDEFKNYLQRAMIVTILFLAPATIGIMLFSEPIIVLLYGRGAFDAMAINLTSSSLFFYSIGMLGFGLREILSRAFYSLQNTRIPMINAIIGILINIVLNIILSRVMGIAGLALATSIAAIVTIVLLYIGLSNRIGALIDKTGLSAIGKILIASFSMGLLAKAIFTLSYPIMTQSHALFASVITGGMCYFLFVYLLKIPYTIELLSDLREYLSKHQREKSSRYSTSPEADLYHEAEALVQNEKNKIVRYRREAPFIGIVIVTHNNPDGLIRTLEQIRTQTFYRYKVYIIDNGSTVNTEEAIRNHRIHFRNITYYRWSTDLGRAAGFHYGFRIAYNQGAAAIWVMEDKAIPHRYALEALVKAYRGLHGKVCLISSLTDSFEPDTLAKIRFRKPIEYIVTELSFQGALIPRSLIEAIGVPRKELNNGYEAEDYFRQAQHQGYCIYRVRDSLLLCKENHAEVRRRKGWRNRLFRKS